MNAKRLNTRQVTVCYSDVYVIQMFIIQIPTVITFDVDEMLPNGNDVIEAG